MTQYLHTISKQLAINERLQMWINFNNSGSFQAVIQIVVLPRS